MITGDNSGVFTQESDVVGSHGGWTAPQSVPRDQATGFESIDAYFDSDHDQGEITSLHLSPSLRNIELGRPLSTPFTSRKRVQSPDFKQNDSIKRKDFSNFDEFKHTEYSPLPKTSKSAAYMQDDGYGGTYDRRLFVEKDREYHEKSSEDEVIDNISEPESVPQHEPEPVVEESPPRTPTPLPPSPPLQYSQIVDRAQSISGPSTPHQVRSPSSPPPHPSSPLPSGRAILNDNDNEGPPPIIRVNIPIDKFDPPKYQESVDVEELPEQDLGDSDASLMSMIIETGTNSGPYVEEDLDTIDSSDFDSEVEEIEVQNLAPSSPPAEGGLRRSLRSRVPKLDSWRGEYVVYQYDPLKGTRTAVLAHTVEPDPDTAREGRSRHRRRPPITVLSRNTSRLETDSGGNDANKAPDFDESIRAYKQQMMAKSLNPQDDDAEEVPFADSPRVMIQTILEGQRNMPVVIAQLTFGRGAAIPPRNSGSLWYTFICWTGKFKFTSEGNAVVLQREGSVTIPAGQDFHIENVGVNPARVLMVQAQSQNIAEEYSRINASRLSNFEDIPSDASNGKHATRILESERSEIVAFD